MGSVKIHDDGSMEFDPYTKPLRDDAVLMLEGLNELIARFEGLALGAQAGAKQNAGAYQDLCRERYRAWKTAADEVRQLRDRFMLFSLHVPK